MYAERVKRVIIMKPGFQFRAGKKQNDSCGNAYDDRAGWIDIAAGRRDDDESADRTGAKPEDAWFAAQNIFEHRPGKRRDCRGQRCRSECVRRNRVGAKRAASIKPVPTNPEHSGADHAEYHRMRREYFFAEPEPRPEQHAKNEC